MLIDVVLNVYDLDYVIAFAAMNCADKKSIIVRINLPTTPIYSNTCSIYLIALIRYSFKRFYFY